MYNDVVKFIEACDQPSSENNADLYARLIDEQFDPMMAIKLEELLNQVTL